MAHSALKRAFHSVLAVTAVISAAILALRALYHNDASMDKKALLTFDVGPMDLVAMTISDTRRYSLDGEGSIDFASLMPTGGHTAHITAPGDPAPQTFTVALFHQLKCLEIYHREYLKPLPRQVTTELRGCLNYLRQSLLCHANTRLESVKNVEVQASKQYETICRDWTKVYEAAERNHDSYLSWESGRKHQ